MPWGWRPKHTVTGPEGPGPRGYHRPWWERGTWPPEHHLQDHFPEPQLSSPWAKHAPDAQRERQQSQRELPLERRRGRCHRTLGARATAAPCPTRSQLSLSGCRWGRPPHQGLKEEAVTPGKALEQHLAHTSHHDDGEDYPKMSKITTHP